MNTINYIIVSTVFLGFFAGNALVWESALLGGGLLIFFLLFYGTQLGAVLTDKTDLTSRAVFGTSALVACLSLVGALGYYLDLLGKGPIVMILALVPFCIALVSRKHQPFSFPRPNPIALIKTLPIIILALATISLLSSHQIIDPVRSPWLVIPGVFFLGLFLIAFLLAGKPSKWLTVVFFFLTISVALLSYPLGYGFDPFIHKATEQHIYDVGSISPKPLYYAGQYGLILTATHGFAIPIDLADNLLVPLLAILLIPLTTFLCFKDWFTRLRPGNPSPSAFAVLALFLVPLTSFITTTPQGLANIWIFLVVATSLPLLLAQKSSLRLPIIFTLAALATHPLSGIPAVIYLGFLCLRSFLHSCALPATVPLMLYAIVSSAALPIIFIVNALHAHLAVSFGYQNGASIFDLLQLSLFAENRFRPLLDAAYLFGWNRTLFLLILTTVGIILLRRQKKSIAPFIVPSMILLINYLLLSTVVHFDFLIDYERQNYAIRAFETAQFFLLPLIGFVLFHLFEAVEKKPLALRFGFTLLSAIILTSAVYMTYPRHDNYEISRGFNVGESDFDTVRFIHDQNTTVDYIVLANQAVSSAAMKEYGFLQYFHSSTPAELGSASSEPNGEDIFYYPIPTGGALYQTYLAMVNDGPTKPRAVEAMNLAGVNKAYFVVNDYWFLADKIIENAKREATDWTAIDNGATYIFEYDR